MTKTDDRNVIKNIPSQIWLDITQRLNANGIFIENDVGFLAKDIIRRNERSVKIHLRRNGYDGTGLVYIEANVSGVNGYAFFCKRRLDRQQAIARLEQRLHQSW